MEEYLLQISETVHKHMKRYSEELVQKLEDLKRSYEVTYSNKALTDILRTQIKVLEARMDTLRDLDEDIQKIVKTALEH